MASIRVSLTYAEAEALLARDWQGEFLHDSDPAVHLHARGKLIDHLLRDPDYVPPNHRSRAAISQSESE